MKNEISTALKMNRIFSSVVTILGIILIIYMISVEGELGALPLFLVVGGTIWFLTTQNRIKKQMRNGSL